jgi:hypothetical protein
MVALLVIHTFSLVKKNKSCYTKLHEEDTKVRKALLCVTLSPFVRLCVITKLH